MTEAPLFPFTPTYALPVSMDADIIVTFLNQTPDVDPPVYEDYPDNTTVSLVIGKATAVVAQAVGVISGHIATCRIPKAQANLIKDGALWRCVVTIPDPNGVDVDSIVPVNGVVERSDGAQR